MRLSADQRIVDAGDQDMAAGRACVGRNVDGMSDDEVYKTASGDERRLIRMGRGEEENALENKALDLDDGREADERIANEERKRALATLAVLLCEYCFPRREQAVLEKIVLEKIAAERTSSNNEKGALSGTERAYRSDVKLALLFAILRETRKHHRPAARKWICFRFAIGALKWRSNYWIRLRFGRIDDDGVQVGNRPLVEGAVATLDRNLRKLGSPGRFVARIAVRGLTVPRLQRYFGLSENNIRGCLSHMSENQPELARCRRFWLSPGDGRA